MPNDDYILRSDALRYKCTFEQSNGVEIEPIDAVPFSYLQNIPAADVEPVRPGRWKRIQWVKDEDWQEGGYWILRCSECVMPYHNPTPYCPHCGAKMQGE